MGADVSETENLEHTDSETGERSFEQTLKSAVYDLWKHSLWVVLYWALLMGGALAYCLFQTPYYRATAKILVNANTVENAGEREMLKNLSLQEVMITSPKIAEEVIAKMELKKLRFFSESEDISKSFLDLLSVKSDVRSGTLEIRFDFPDSQKAAAIANQIADIYVHSTSERSEGTTQDSMEALKQQLRSEQTKQNELRAKIAETAIQHPEVTEEEGLQGQVDFLNKELLKTENRLMEVQSILEELDGFQKSGESIDAHPYIQSHPNIASKLDRIRELELSLVELRQDYREMYPQITQTKAKITALKNILKGDEDKIVLELRRELGSRERNRNEIKSSIQKIQGRLQSATPEKTKYKDALTELASTDEAIRALNKRISDFAVEGSLKRSSLDLEILSLATPPSHPFKPNVPKNLFMAVAFGVFSSLGMFYLKHYFSRAVEVAEDVYRTLRRPLVGQIVFFKKEVSPELELADAKSERPYAGMFDLILANSAFLVGKESNYSVLVTSAVPDEGKTFIAYHLSRALAARGKKTVLIDADFCRARLTEHFSEVGIKPFKTLDEYLTGKTDEKDLIISTYDSLLDFIAAGTERASAPQAFCLSDSKHRQSPLIKELIEKLKISYDIIIFDTPPVLPVNDAVALSSSVDLCLFVIKGGKTSEKDIHHALKKLDPLRKIQTGVILNQVSRIDRGYDYYNISSKK